MAFLIPNHNRSPFIDPVNNPGVFPAVELERNFISRMQVIMPVRNFGLSDQLMSDVCVRKNLPGEFFESLLLTA